MFTFSEKLLVSPLPKCVGPLRAGLAEKSTAESFTSRGRVRLSWASYTCLMTLACSTHWISHRTSSASMSSLEETTNVPSRFSPKATLNLLRFSCKLVSGTENLFVNFLNNPIRTTTVAHFVMLAHCYFRVMFAQYVL